MKQSVCQLAETPIFHTSQQSVPLLYVSRENQQRFPVSCIEIVHWQANIMKNVQRLMLLFLIECKNETEGAFCGSETKFSRMNC